MGRHANGKNNYSLSGGALAVLALALVAVVAVVLFSFLRSHDEASSEAGGGNGEKPVCVSGDLVLPVASSNKEVAQSLISDYATTSPVVRDFCVKPVYADNAADAAVYIAPDSPTSSQALGRENRSAATSNPQPAYSEEIGVAVPATLDVVNSYEELDSSSVVFPLADESDASALVAAQLFPDDQAAVDALVNQRRSTREEAQRDEDKYFPTSRSRLPQGYTFVPADAQMVYSTFPLNQSGNVSEDQARAGQDFARFSAERFTGNPEISPAISESVWAAAAPSTNDGAEDAAVGGEAEITSTLFVLDTSESMAPYLSSAASGITSAAQKVAETGGQVALWNYSSPLTLGVTQGFRRNVLFTPDSGAVADSVGRFQSGGQPNTHEAVLAA